MPEGKKVKISEILCDSKLITEEQLQQAEEIQQKQGGKIIDIVCNQGFVNEIEMLRTIAKQLDIPLIELEHFVVKQNIINKLPERIARRFKVLALDYLNGKYLVGFADPTDVLAYDEVSRMMDAPVYVAMVRGSDLVKMIDRVYRRTDEIVSFAEALKDELTEADITTSLEKEFDDASPVAKMLESIFTDAVQVGASDIHIEPDDGLLRIRQRVDGVLQEEIIPGRQIIDALVLRIKLISKLNISEKRIPQDGRFHMRVSNRDIDVRVSTMPVQFGESVVMRLLDQSKGLLYLNKMEIVPYVLERIKFHVHRPHGLIVLTGPTGSGKSTTLYAMINELNEKTKKIITIEDPIEYSLPRVNQVQTNATIDLTFARVLRAALRQDPEVVMIGEMRDEETARIALRAALTGHLVLSTLHTNDSISSAMRLLDMGIEGFLVAAAVRLVVSQRLIRKICDGCSQVETISQEEETLLKLLVGDIDPSWKFCKGSGCSRCNGGYSGRLAVHEILEIDTLLADILRTGDSTAFALAARKQKNFKTLAIAALDYAIDGKTTLEEVFRVAGEVEDVNKDEKENS